MLKFGYYSPVWFFWGLNNIVLLYLPTAELKKNKRATLRHHLSARMSGQRKCNDSAPRGECEWSSLAGSTRVLDINGFIQANVT